MGSRFSRADSPRSSWVPFQTRGLRPQALAGSPPESPLRPPQPPFFFGPLKASLIPASDHLSPRLPPGPAARVSCAGPGLFTLQMPGSWVNHRFRSGQGSRQRLTMVGRESRARFPPAVGEGAFPGPCRAAAQLRAAPSRGALHANQRPRAPGEGLVCGARRCAPRGFRWRAGEAR